MKITYAGKDGTGPMYDIESDRHGNYSIKKDGKVVKRVSSIPNYLGKPKWGSAKLEQDAIEDAKAAIDSFRTDEG